MRRFFARGSIFLLLGVVIGSLFGGGLISTAAEGDYGSGKGSGPIGTPVISTVSYTNISHYMIVGDSITVRGYKALAAQVPGKRLAVNAHSGRNTQLSIDSLVKSMQQGMKIPPVLIMATGTNDIFNPPVMAGQIARIKALAPGVKIVWVTVYAKRIKLSQAVQQADLNNSMWINMQIMASGVKTCGWAENFLSKPSRFSLYLSGDGVHPNHGAGVNNWAAIVGMCAKAAMA